MVSPSPNGALFLELEHLDAPLPLLAERLGAADPGVVQAAVAQLARRVRAGEAATALFELLPSDLGTLPPRAQRTLAALATDGHGGPLAAPRPEDPAAVRLAWLRARLLRAPTELERWEGTALGRAAVTELPAEEVVASGLLDCLAQSRDPWIRAAAPGYLSAAARGGLLAGDSVHALALALARADHPPTARAALELLAEPWAEGRPLPDRAPPPGDPELAGAWIALLRARGAKHPLRALASADAPGFPRAEVLVALGEAGDAEDLAWLVNRLTEAPELDGAAAALALRALRRRGHSLDAAAARAVLRASLGAPALDPEVVAEALGECADAALDVLDALDGPAAPWARAAALLEAIGSREAVRRLLGLGDAPAAREGWGRALEALGRLGAARAEGLALRRLDDEPAAALSALARVGTEVTVQWITELLDLDPPSSAPWLSAAATLALRLAPTPALVDRLLARGLLTGEALEAAAHRGVVTQHPLLREAAATPGHPLRAAAIGALGRGGGALEVAQLAPLVGDADPSVRDAALDALRRLGQRLHEARSPRPAGLTDAADPERHLVADALLELLRDRPPARAAAARMLEALVDCAHPRMLAVLAPYLGDGSPEVRARALACLRTVGAAALPWVRAGIADPHREVAHRALDLLAGLGLRGGHDAALARLGGPDRGLALAAATALSTTAPSAAIPGLLDALAACADPAAREPLLRALACAAQGYARAVLVDRLDATWEPLPRQRLVEALERGLEPAALAALLRLRGKPTPAPGLSAIGSRPPGRASERRREEGPWTELLLGRARAGASPLAAHGEEAPLIGLERELARRGLLARDAADGVGARPARARRDGVRLRQLLRRSSPSAAEVEELLALLGRGAGEGEPLVDRLDALEAHALVTLWARLGAEPARSSSRPSPLPGAPAERAPEATGAVRILSPGAPRLEGAALAGARRLLAGAELDEVLRARLDRVVDLVDPRTGAELRADLADLAPRETARALLASPAPALRARANAALVLEEDVQLADWPPTSAEWPLVRLLHDGKASAALRAAVPRGAVRALVGEMRALYGASYTAQLLTDWSRRQPALAGDLVPELAQLDGPGRDALAALLLEREAPPALRLLAASATPGALPLPLAEALYADPDPRLRARGAQGLLAAGGRAERGRVLAAYLGGALAEDALAGLPALGEEDLPLLREALAHPAGEAGLRGVALLGRLAHPERPAMLLALWRDASPELRAPARDALRALAPTELIPLLLRGDALEASLEVLGDTAALPDPLLARAVPERPAWRDLLLRCAAGGKLHAPGLLARLLPALDAEPALGAVLAPLLRTHDWSNDTATRGLLDALEPHLDSRWRTALLGALAEATDALGGEARARVLGAVGEPGDAAVVAALADAVLDAPEGWAVLDPELHAAVDHALSEALARGEDPARVGRILADRARRATSEPARRALVDALDRALDHPEPELRRYAYLLLRAHADGARYLQCTTKRLRDGDPETVVDAVRTLAAHRHLEAVGELADLAFHPDSGVRAAARGALLGWGEAALAPLVKATGRARPDRRRALVGLVSELRRRALGETLSG